MKIIVEKPSIGRFVWEAPPGVAQSVQTALKNIRESGLPQNISDTMEAALIDQYKHLIEGFLLLLGNTVIFGGDKGIAMSEMIDADLKNMVRKSAEIMGARGE